MGEFDDIIPEYINESTELLEVVEGGLLRLEQGEMEEEAIHTVFRAIHSIKGGAGFVGLGKIEHLAHKMEDLLNLIRNGDLVAGRAVTDALLLSLDVLKSLFERVDEHEAIEVESSIACLDQALHGSLGAAVESEYQTKGSPPPESGLPPYEIREYVLKSKLQQGFVYHLTLDLGAVEKRGLTPIKLVNEMLSMGEILDSVVVLPSQDDAQAYRGDTVHIQVLYATVLEPDLLVAALFLEECDARALGEDDFALLAPPAPAGAPPTPVEDLPAAAAPVPGPAPATAPAPPAAPPAPMASAAPAPGDPPAATATRQGEYLTFQLARENYAVDVLSVQEIIGLPPLARLPRSPVHVLGVINLRGMVVPVLDLRLLLGLPAQETAGVVVVLRVGEKIMGAVVDGVEDVVPVAEDQVQDAPEFAAAAVDRDCLKGLFTLGKELIILLDLPRLLGPGAVSHAA
ncbi:MAG: chemotaxis protein CheW [Deltaproteobacteria bacterium]|nr:chemotaxis protein CheW [Deltaproteobacteria bacterium]